MAESCLNCLKQKVQLAKLFMLRLLWSMTLTLPDAPMPPGMTPEVLRLELACALYARGKLTKIRGAEFAGVDLFAFQNALKERRISTYTIENLDQEITTLKEMFPNDV